MKSVLNRIVEFGFLPADDADLRLKKVALTLVPLIIGPAALVWGGVYFLLGHPLSAAIPMAYSIISALSLGYFFKTKRTAFIQYSQLLLVLLLPFLLMWSLGGFAGGSLVMIWAIFAPIAALLFFEKQTALNWFLAYFGLLLVSGLIDSHLAATVTLLPEWARDVFYLLNVGCGSAGLFLLVSYAIDEEKRAIETLKAQRQQLETGAEKLSQEIGERKQVQAELGAAMAKSDKLNRMLHTVLDTIPAGIFWKDRQLRYLGCNRPFALEAGLSSPREVAGKTDFDLSWQASADVYHADDLQVMASGQAKMNSEERVCGADGTFTWLRISKAPLFDATGDVIGLLGTYEDITEQKQVADTLIAARDEADRANQAKSEFLSSMSHELRTPMNAILGFGQLLECDEALPADQQDNVYEILRAGRHLLELINEVLDLSVIESGRLDLSLEPVAVDPIVAECLSLVATLADRRDIRIHCSGLQDSAVRADRIRLKQVLLNLLSNAIKYNRQGGSVQLDVQLADAQSGDLQSADVQRLRIAVSDTGPGIPAERLGELFQPFNRLGAENSEIEGTGIGLIITRRIVEMMGGRVDVASTLGVGSAFWIELPFESAPSYAHGGETEAAGAITPLPYREGVRHTVLYLEDNPANLKLMAQVFSRRPNIQLLTAHTPDLGIELARAHRPELILLDINLPGMNGYQVLEVLKADAGLRTTPVIAITANAMRRDIERGMAAGFTDYLAKPLDVVRLNALIDQTLGSRAPRQGAEAASPAA